MSVSKSVCLSFCLLFAVAALNAQSSTPAQAVISGSDQAAAAAPTKFVYRIVPAATAAAKKLPASKLTNIKLTASTTVPQPGFFPADLAYHGGPVVRTAHNNPVYFDCVTR